MKLKIILGAVLALVVIGGLGGAFYAAGTPQYSLYLIKNAIESHDSEAFFELFDTEQVISHTVERAVGGVPAGPKVVSKKATEVLIPAATSVLKEKIQERFDDPTPVPLAGRSIGSVSYQGKYAFVELLGSEDQKPTKITLEQMKSRRWKIVDVDLSQAGISFTLDDARRRAEDTGVPGALLTPDPGEIPTFPGPRR